MTSKHLTGKPEDSGFGHRAIEEEARTAPARARRTQQIKKILSFLLVLALIALVMII